MPAVTSRANLVLAALFVATLVAVLLTQRVKDAPALVRNVHVSPRFTPNGDGYRDRALITFAVGRSDRVVVEILDAHDRLVRRVGPIVRRGRGRYVAVRWFGRTDAKRPAPAGTYRVRVILRRRGETIVLRDSIELLRVPPRRGRARSR
jgi:hypothetical protein